MQTKLDKENLKEYVAEDGFLLWDFSQHQIMHVMQAIDNAFDKFEKNQREEQIALKTANLELSLERRENK